MAIVAGLTVYEVGLLAAGAVTVLWFSTPMGQKAAQQTVEGAADALDRIKSRATTKTTDLAPPIPKTDCPKEKKKCPPCRQPPPPEIDRVPPSRPHFPCPGDHWHYYVYHQNPETCQCFGPYREFGGCLEQGGSIPEV